MTTDTDIQPGVIARVAGVLRDQLNQWFPPMQPLPRVAPAGTPPRRLDYPVGVNLQIQPRLDRFQQLRTLADGYGLLRLVIETFKDQMVKSAVGDTSYCPAGAEDRRGSRRSPDRVS